MGVRGLVLLVGVIVFMAVGHRAAASAPGCGQAPVEALLGAPAPPGPSKFYIVPNDTVTPFYQWENNNGYCGEVSLMSAGLSNGQWISQYNTRMVCGGFFGPETNGSGPSLLQAGNAPRRWHASFNAQLLVESPSQGLSGPYDYDWAARCAANAGLSLVQYPSNTGYLAPNSGLAGYKDFMSWVKAQTIAGHQTVIGVLINGMAGGIDPQYDHIVTVIKIGTNHSPADANYYPDDVLYLEDHGAFTLRLTAGGVWKYAANPGIPPGAGGDVKGCTPYIYRYRFDAFVRTRAQENAKGAPVYAVVMPDAGKTIRTITGNTAATGDGRVPINGPHDVAFAITGPIDPQGETLPVSLVIMGTSSLVKGKWVANPADENSVPPAMYNYENPEIGFDAPVCDYGACATNTQPDAMKMMFEATVHGLTPGVAYNLYEYDFPEQTGALTGTAAALAIPTGDFNAQSGAASYVRPFVATGASYTFGPIVRSSREIVLFRAVRADGP